MNVIYCEIAGYKYYWAGRHWVQWKFAAKLVPDSLAAEQAKELNANFEKIN